MSNSKPSKNALSHGAYSRDAILPWENAQDFKDLHEELREEYLPSGPSEEETVFDLARLHRKKRRLNVAFQLTARRDAPINQLVDAGHREGWSGIIDYIATTPHDSNASIRELIEPYLMALKSTSACVSRRPSRCWRLTRLAKPMNRRRPTN